MNPNTVNLPGVVLKSLYESIINDLKNDNASSIGDIAKYAISQYYMKGDKHFDLLQENFIEKYVDNESLVEGVHSCTEKEGLKKIYQFIFSNYNDVDIDVDYLLKLHEILYSNVPFSEVGGKLRKAPAHLEGTVVSLCPWEEISTEIKKTNKWINQIVKQSFKVSESNNFDLLFEYIDECLKLNCHLIQIHPFFDGNGRTIRAFTNKLFILTGIPPVYIHAKEKKLYHKAMEKAIVDNDFSSINQFYYIKICQSIYELGINPNKDLKAKTDFKKIKKIVENYKIATEQETSSINDLSIHYSEFIRQELEREKIFSEIYMVNSCDGEYDYLTAKIEKDSKVQNIIIDPFFSNFILVNNIKIDSNLSYKDREFLTYLYNDGIAKANTSQLELYLQTLGVLTKSKDKKFTKTIN